jgi:predicted nuclease of predicted toxin-antitoxin system
VFGVRGAVGECAADSPIGCLKFIIDAQLPRRLATWLTQQGHACIHTKDLPLQNRTTDSQILRIARDEDRCVITKDSDFQMSFELGRGPRHLLLVSTGNLDNDRLIRLFERHHDRIVEGFQTNSFIEVTLTSLIIHS